MSKYQLKISNPSINGTTGHHTIEVQIIENAADDKTEGVVEKYGIDSAALQSKYGGDVDKWIQDVGQDMLQKHQNRRNVSAKLLSMDGHLVDL